MYSFLPGKEFGKLANTEPKSLIAINSEFSFIEIWFTNQNIEGLDIEDSVNITLIVGPKERLIEKIINFRNI